MTRRRDLLLVGAAVGAAYGLAWWIKRPKFDFYEMKSPKGFRRIGLGATSGTAGSNIFVGLGGGDASSNEKSGEKIPDDKICSSLFEGDLSPGKVNIASFSDYNCSYCRILTREIQAVEKDTAVSVTWHELPLLGPTSVAAARLALAAGMQGAYHGVHTRLMAGRFVPTPAFTTAIARDFGLDVEKLGRDQSGVEVEGHLRRASALAQTFGIFGTPALVVGRTLVIGNISPRQLRELIEIEAASPGKVC